MTTACMAAQPVNCVLLTSQQPNVGAPEVGGAPEGGRCCATSRPGDNSTLYMDRRWPRARHLCRSVLLEALPRRSLLLTGQQQM
jgi:hypothetical protein